MDLPTSPECQYLKGRAQQEWRMTLNADSCEAEAAHNELTGLYLRACVDCRDGDSAECVACPLRPICEREIRRD